MKITCCGVASCVVAALIVQGVEARGVSPYLPLSLSPEIERQIEKVLALADKPVVRRPIAAATVLDALPKACARDRALCEEVRRYLSRYMNTVGVTALRPELAATTGDSKATIPNQHGEMVDSAWRLSVAAYLQPNDYMLVNVGGIAYDGTATPTGSMLSLGFDFAQLDIGFRDHWYSPMSDSSSLISTQAPTMPSITLSNYEPISPLGLSYEVFAAEMSYQEGIQYFDGATAGRPRLAGMQASIEPASGYALTVNRITQYGGGARDGNATSDFIDALFTSNNQPDTQGQAQESGNKAVSITSSMLFQGKIPFGVSIEYAGEDNAFATGYRLGATNLSLGLDFPRLWKDFDAGYEISEWQNDWYVHHLYPRGLTNKEHAIGHWFGDERQFGNAIGGRSQMFRFGWRREAGEYVQATYRTMALDPAWARGQPVPAYNRLHELGLFFFTIWHGRAVGLELRGGQDVFGDSFARIAGTVDLVDGKFAPDDASDLSSDEDPDGDTELFVDFGANHSSVLKFLVLGTPSPPIVSTNGFHLGVGARRSVSKRGDLGARLEVDDVEGYRLLSLRALDYRYRITHKFAASGFFGFGRYDVGLPANGYYWGAGVQFIDLVPKWDIGFDLRHYEKLNRDKTLPTDPPSSAEGHPRIYFDIDGMSLYLTRRW